MSKRLLSAGGNVVATNLYGQVATVFGGYGTVGLGITNAMASHGNILILPYHRSSADFRQSQLAAQDPWNYHPVQTDFNKPAQLREVIEPSDNVIVSLGRLVRPNVLRWRDLGWGYDAIYRQLPVDIAKMCVESGKETMVYISQIGADVDSESKILRAKGRAEIEIREIMPSAIIIRPSDAFSMQGSHTRDHLRHLARMMLHKSVVGFDEMFNRVSYPVFVGDIGVACAHALRDPACWGKTYEIGGRQRFTMKETMKLISAVTNAPNDTIRLPYELCKLYGQMKETITWDTAWPKDYYVQKQYNSIPNERSDPEIYGWEDLGIDRRNLVLIEEVIGDSLYNYIVRRKLGSAGPSNQMDMRFTF